MNSYHNPAKIDLSLVGPNHRLLTADQLDHPLPEGAEYWDGSGWSSLPLFKVVVPEVTYRIPLTLRDRIEREIGKYRQKAIEKEELLKVVEAVEQGAVYEVEVDSKWLTPQEQFRGLKNIEENLLYNRAIRLKPSPSSIPWTLETRPLSEVWVKPKTSMKEYLILGWVESGAVIYGMGVVPYKELHRDWLQRNGEPCGKEVQS